MAVVRRLSVKIMACTRKTAHDRELVHVAPVGVVNQVLNKKDTHHQRNHIVNRCVLQVTPRAVDRPLACPWENKCEVLPPVTLLLSPLFRQ